MSEKKRRVYSVKDELLKKSQEAALAAIQIFNNPLITFKSESFIVLMNIAWTYLLHAYYRDQGVDYRHYIKKAQRKKYETTVHGAHKYWELERCLNEKSCPLELPVIDNLRFLIGIRHEIEHQMTSRIDDFISAKFQANCINYNDALKSLFGKSKGLDKTIPIALQLFSFGENQINQLKGLAGLPQNMIDFISDYEDGIQSKSDPRYSYRVIYIRDNVNHEGQADVAYRFLDEKSSDGKEIHNVLVKRVTKKKLSESEVLSLIQGNGFPNFNKTAHQNFWKERWSTAHDRNSNSNANNYGELIMSNIWMWYEDSWLPEVMRYCKSNRDRFV
jgi:hypothetical protein